MKRMRSASSRLRLAIIVVFLCSLLDGHGYKKFGGV